MAGSTGSDKSSVRAKIREWKKTKAAQRGRTMPSFNFNDVPF